MANNGSQKKSCCSKLQVASLALTIITLITVVIFGFIVVSNSGGNDVAGNSKSDCQSKWNALQSRGDKADDEDLKEEIQNIMGEKEAFIDYCTTGNQFNYSYNSNIKEIDAYLSELDSSESLLEEE